MFVLKANILWVKHNYFKNRNDFYSAHFSQDNVTREVVNDVIKDSLNDVTNRLANMERQIENLVLLSNLII